MAGLYDEAFEHYDDKFSKTAKEVIAVALKLSEDIGQGYLGTEHLLLAILSTDNTARKILEENKLTFEKVYDSYSQLVLFTVNEDEQADGNDTFSPQCRRVLLSANEEAQYFGQKIVGTEHILLAMIKEETCLANRLMNTLDVRIQNVFADCVMVMGGDAAFARMEYVTMKAKARNRENGPSITENFARDMTALAREGELDPCIGREREIDRLIQVLSRRTKNNPCLVGEPGVGKTAVLEGLAARIVAEQVPETMLKKRILSLDLSAMVAGTKYRGEFEERMKRLIDEVSEDPDIILFVDELHTIIGAGGAEGSMDAANILKPALARGELQLIGATTLDEYRKHIEKDAALERRFQPITIEEPSLEETIEILKGLKHVYEEHHKVKISDEALVACAKLTARYVNDRFLPDKAIDAMDEAAARLHLDYDKGSSNLPELLAEYKKCDAMLEEALVKNRNKKASELFDRIEELKAAIENEKELSKAKKPRKGRELKEEHIEKVIAMWTKIPLEKVQEAESERLLKMPELLKKRVKGQDEAVNAITKAIRRARVGLKDPNRPIGSFLFLGPTGVGKTELSKALAEAMFGDENAMIRVDMSEYMEKHSIAKFIGAPPGYVGHDDGGQLSEQIRRKPYSVVLFDELEKAHPDVFNILLQVLEDGHITDSQGRKVSFKNTIIIMTSNAGAQSIISPKKLGFTASNDENSDYERMKSGVMDELKNIFKPEFLNRIDETIVFKQLSKETLKSIAVLQLDILKKRCKDQMGIDFEYGDDVTDFILGKGYDDKFGARPIRRAVQNQIEDALAEEILKDRKITKIKAFVQDDRITFAR